MDFLTQQLFMALAIASPSMVHTCPVDLGWRHKLVIHHIDVGQGDSTFIRTPGGTTVLIDGGLPKMGLKHVLPTLWRCYRLRKLDYMVLTHFDADHMGGLTEVLQNIKVTKALYDPGDASSRKSRKPNSVFSRYKREADKTGKRSVPVVGEWAFPTGDNTKITVAAVNGRVWKKGQTKIFKDGKPKDDNAISIALKVGYGTFDYFIGGDLTGGGNGKPNVEKPVAQLIGDMDIVHSNHHGSLTSNSLYFFQKTKPEFVIISVGNGGRNKSYHLPSHMILERLLKDKNVKLIFQTSSGLSKINIGRLVMNKILNAKGDVVVVAGPQDFTINGIGFRGDRK